MKYELIEQKPIGEKIWDKVLCFKIKCTPSKFSRIIFLRKEKIVTLIETGGTYYVDGRTAYKIQTAKIYQRGMILFVG